MANLTMAHINQFAPVKGAHEPVGFLPSSSNSSSFHHAYGQAKEQLHSNLPTSGKRLPNRQRVHVSQGERAHSVGGHRAMNASHQRAQPTSMKKAASAIHHAPKKQTVSRSDEAHRTSVEHLSRKKAVHSTHDTQDKKVPSSSAIVYSQHVSHSSSKQTHSAEQVTGQVAQKSQVNEETLTDAQKLLARLEQAQKAENSMDDQASLDQQLKLANQLLDAAQQWSEQHSDDFAAGEKKQPLEVALAMLMQLKEKTESSASDSPKDSKDQLLQLIQLMQSNSPQSPSKTVLTQDHVDESLAKSLHKALEQLQKLAKQNGEHDSSDAPLSLAQLQTQLAELLNQSANNKGGESSGQNSAKMASKTAVQSLSPSALLVLAQLQRDAAQQSASLKSLPSKMNRSVSLESSPSKIDQSASAMGSASDDKPLLGQVQALLAKLTDISPGDAAGKSRIPSHSDSAAVLRQSVNSASEIVLSRAQDMDKQAHSKETERSLSTPGKLHQSAHVTADSSTKDHSASSSLNTSVQHTLKTDSMKATNIEGAGNGQSLSQVDSKTAPSHTAEVSATDSDQQTNRLQSAVHQATHVAKTGHHGDTSIHQTAQLATHMAASEGIIHDATSSGLGGQSGSNQQQGQSHLSQNGSIANAKSAPTFANQLAMNQNNQQLPSELNERIKYMMSNKLQSADIRLDPAHMGSMQIRLSMQHDQAQVQIHVQNQHAREMLEQTLPKLKDMLSQQGIQLGQSQISHGNPGGGQAQQNLAQNQQGGGHAPLPNWHRESEGLAEHEVDTPQLVRSRAQVFGDDKIDYYA